jgi:hypothetical protein
MSIDDPRFVILLFLILLLVPIIVHRSRFPLSRFDLAIRSDSGEMQSRCIEKVAQACWSVRFGKGELIEIGREGECRI